MAIQKPHKTVLICGLEVGLRLNRGLIKGVLTEKLRITEEISVHSYSPRKLCGQCQQRDD